MNLEQLIQKARADGKTHETSLLLAQERMRKLNLKLGKEFKDQQVTEELLNRTISL